MASKRAGVRHSACESATQRHRADPCAHTKARPHTDGGVLERSYLLPGSVHLSPGAKDIHAKELPTPDVLRDGGAANVLVFGYCVGDIFRLYGWPSYRTTTRPLVHRGEGSHGSVPPPPELLSGGPTGSKEAVAVGGGCPTREQ